MNSITINAKQITVTFGAVDVLKNVDLELHPAEIHAIIGENGAGKSSLAKVIAGEYRPREGTIELNNKQVNFKNPKEALRHRIALIHQEPITFQDLDITENIFAGHHPRKLGFINWKAAHQQAQEILNKLGTNLNPHAKVAGLSVAQQQMVELAAAMSHDAKVWIFDETTAPLTPKEVEELFAIMRNLRDQGCTIAMVTHHLEEVFAIADRITVLRDGIKVAEKTPKETNTQELIQLMIGRELSNFSPSPAAMHRAPQERGLGGEVSLQLTNLTGPGFTNVSLEIKAGEFVALMGASGSGKSTLMNILGCLDRPTSGHYLLDDADVSGLDRDRLADIRNRKIGFVFQNFNLLPRTSARENVELPLVYSAQHLTKGLSQTTKQFAERLRIAHRNLEQPVLELSGGNQQKVVLSKWLMTNPKLLILDEPTRGVDVGAKQEVHQLIKEQAANGIAILMISSDLLEIIALSNRIVVMRKGTTVATLDSKTAAKEQIMSAAFGQEASVGA